MNKAIKTMMMIGALALLAEMAVICHQTKRIEKAIEQTQSPTGNHPDSVNFQPFVFQVGGLKNSEPPTRILAK